MREIFVIGSESESVMMRWAIRLLSCYPIVQKRIQEEIDTVVGKGKQVSWDLRSKMPYTMAVLKEIQRFADIAPTGLLHKTVCDVSLGGFELPQVNRVLKNNSQDHIINYIIKGTLVMANLSACHRDPKFWSKPDQFYPEHFLENGALVEDKPGFLPYGVGKRMCPGATLADMQVKLILTKSFYYFVF